MEVLPTTHLELMELQRCFKLKLIQQRTGHRSLEALRRYEHTSVSQLVDISNVMSNDPVPAPVIQNYQSSVSSTSVTTENPASIIFKGCSFTGCSISMSGQATNKNNYENDVQDLLHDIDISAGRYTGIRSNLWYSSDTGFNTGSLSTPCNSSRTLIAILIVRFPSSHHGMLCLITMTIPPDSWPMTMRHRGRIYHR